MQEEEEEVVEEEVVEGVLQHDIATLHSDRPVGAVEVDKLEVVDIEWVALLDDIVERDPSNVVVVVGHSLAGLGSVLEMGIFLRHHDHDHGPDQNSDYDHDLENDRLHGRRREIYTKKHVGFPLAQM